MNYKFNENQEKLQIVDGPHKGKTFIPGRVYEKHEIPENLINRFSPVKEAPKPAKTSRKKPEKDEPEKIPENKEPGDKKEGV